MTDQLLRIVRGTPTPEELAVVTAVVAAASAAGDEEHADAPPRGRWNDPAACHRQLRRAGPGAWRAALR
ncbi:MAG: acetyl-CoA carboxylase biotin carboxyl carrier protein subunit [Pseudonocardiales bacterium]|nr:MAG: acetyl-CoA carboxylase biotin carboxyl carrier protein subunit [Pseudonocardiales bacterium]